MDTNIIRSKIGVGEREGRVYSNMIKKRYFHLSHGIGRSGDILAIQPKAPGSTLIQLLTHKLMLNALKTIGLGKVKKCIILPVATGMALTLSMLYLKKLKPHARYVIFLRID